MINELTIKGLKCFDEVEFSFQHLTPLAGKNSLGKSTVIQALLAMIDVYKRQIRNDRRQICITHIIQTGILQQSSQVLRM